MTETISGSPRIIDIISSKSDAHRALICSALSQISRADGEISNRDFADRGSVPEGRATCSDMFSGELAVAKLAMANSQKNRSVEEDAKENMPAEFEAAVICNSSSKDIDATIACLKALLAGESEMHPGESGSTLRFLLPVMGALGHKADFYGEGRLPERPLSPLYEELIAHGCTISPIGSIPLTIEGQLKPGTFTIAGDVSSQYISGLLFALPLLKGDSRIVITGSFESRAYVDMTLKVLRDFGIQIGEEESGFFVRGNQNFQTPSSYRVEGDWSNGCFWLAAGALVPGGVSVRGLNPQSLQGDKAILELLRQFGAEVRVLSGDSESCSTGGAEAEGASDGFDIGETVIRISPGELKAIEIDASQIPDMVPILSVIAAVAEGDTVIKNAGRLRIKESDRLATVTEVMNGLGADIDEKPDGLVIHGVSKLTGGKISSHNDHRIAMMAAIASLVSENPVVIEGKEAVAKSYPEFFKDMAALGLDGKVE